MEREVFKQVKVADFTWALIGPLTTKYLADYGATVIRVESMKSIDVNRITAPFKDGQPGVNRSGYFAYFNANKYSMCLDMKHPRAIEVAKRLVGWSDIVVENFRPGVIERWGLGYEDLQKIKPDIIMLRLSNRGQTGPHANHATLGVPMGGEAGFCYFTGWPDRDPLTVPVAYLDTIAPRFAAALLAAALIHRQRTGKGQCLDISQLEAGVQFLAPVLLQYTANGTESGRMGNSCYYAAPHGVYRCRGEDAWCAITVFTDEEWNNFCSVLGNSPWTHESRFATILGRKENEEELNVLVEEWTMQFSPEEVMALLQKAGVAAGVVADSERLYQDPQLKERGQFWPLDHPELGLFSHLGEPSRLSKTPARARMPAPNLGQHTEYVCTKILGMSDNKFLELFNTGVFE